MIELGPPLLVLTIATPLALALLALIPSQGALMRTLPWAAVPGLAAAIMAPRDQIVRLPDVLLGVGLSITEADGIFLGFVSLIWITAGFYARNYFGAGERVRAFAGFWLLTLAGNLGIFIAVDVVTFYISFSFLSLAAFGLVIHDRTAIAHRAGRVYIVLAIFGEICLLLAFMIGTAAEDGVLITDVSAGIALSQQRTLAMVLLIMGFGLKAGLVPLHVWLPLAHPAAPTPASAVLSGAIVKAGIFGFMKFTPLGSEMAAWGDAFVIMGLVTAYYGIAIGITQSNPKTVLAYSTLSQMGLVITVIGAGLDAANGGEAKAAATLYATHHGLAKGALFLGVGVMAASGEPTRRLVLVATAIMALAIAGFPLTGGALAKLTAKAPLGDGLVSLLATLSAAGTTLVMLRFLFVISQSAPHSPDDVPSPGLLLPWAATVVAAVAIPWYLFPEISGYSFIYPLTPANLWDALWPIALGTAVAFITAHLRLRMPRVPEGDLVVVGESVSQAMARTPREVREPPFSAQTVARFATAVSWLAALSETMLSRWSNAGALLVILAAFVGFILLQ